jgi:hypothetical protein
MTSWDKIPNWLQSLLLILLVAGLDYLLNDQNFTWKGLALAVVAALFNWLTTWQAKKGTIKEEL